ncbi:MAG: hypothetical protein ACI9XZ_004277, partial [Alphaproteobacteria bacterium]
RRHSSLGPPADIAKDPAVVRAINVKFQLRKSIS